MKRILFICTVLFIFSACKKSDTNSAYELKCTIDGVVRTFNVQSIAGRPSANGLQAITVGGMAKAGNEESFGFIIINDPSKKPIVTGTYQDNTTEFEILANHSMGQNGPDYLAGTEVRKEFNMAGATIQNPFKVTITSMTNESIRGTFSGDFYLEGQPGQTKRTISNGVFNLKFF
jgi:hypothetical protein